MAIQESQRPEAPAPVADSRHPTPKLYLTENCKSRFFLHTSEENAAAAIHAASCPFGICPFSIDLSKDSSRFMSSNRLRKAQAARRLLAAQQDRQPHVQPCSQMVWPVPRGREGRVSSPSTRRTAAESSFPTRFANPRRSASPTRCSCRFQTRGSPPIFATGSSSRSDESKPSWRNGTPVRHTPVRHPRTFHLQPR